jgi:hypothetical protein
MKTQKQLLTEHRKQLDERYHEKYPQGQFVLQYRGYYGDMGSTGNDAHYNIHWNPTRSTSHCRYKGISVEHRTYSGEVVHSDYQNCSFGKCNSYDTLDKLLAACAKRNIPTELVDAFVERYNNREKEGFKI